MKNALLAGIGMVLMTGVSAHAQAPGPYTVYFGFNAATLDMAAQQVVADAAASYAQTGSARVEVTGYADRSGAPGYNDVLSGRRADAVRAALVQRGVPESAISVSAQGENDPAVATADGQSEARNRRVEIAMQAPAPMAEAAAPVMPAPVAAVVEPVTEAMHNGTFSLGALYGYNMEDQGGTGSDDKTSHLAGVNLGFDYGVTDFVAVSLEQGVFYNAYSGDSGIGGRSAAGVDFTLGRANVIPHIGANIGYIYGSGIEDSAFAGPEVGINIFGFDAKVAYDMPFNRSADDGIIVATVGLGLKF